ncbi:hypothetical protein [Motilibacter deserti]|uniref:Uncharacterized protein n=1 Tax=Motilibacter deserti TaxID=2714956 RepID=A0ABX0GSM2_9ACTN|nr:hypothetical protein [Motilibacter deserti]NHC13101.1 hypothetical protein [Motilibacter deserti]
MIDTAVPAVPLAAAPAGRRVVGATRLDADAHDAEHLLADLVRVVAANDPSVVACTHLVSSPWRHVAVSVSFAAAGPAGPELVAGLAAALGEDVALAAIGPGPVTLHRGPDQGRRGAREAAVEHATRSEGKVVVFPGQQALVGELPLAEVLTASAVEQIECLSGAYEPDSTLRVVGGFVRPRLRAGAMVLHCSSPGPRELVPWEMENPPQCGGH